MIVRPIDWRDLPRLMRCRHQSIFLDSALVLTRGSLLLPGAVLSYLIPGAGVFTCIGNDEDKKIFIIGQAIQNPGTHFAHLTFFAPDHAVSSGVISGVLSQLVVLAGQRGAQHMVADVEDDTPIFEALQKDNFAVYVRQRIWKIGDRGWKHTNDAHWRQAMSVDGIAIRTLYNNLVPGLVQQVEPFSMENPQGLVHYEAGELIAYIDLKVGHRGIWAQPFIHPGTDNFSEQLNNLMASIPNRYARPVYICVRSYQSWLETAIEDLGAEAGERQAVMVKHMAVVQRAKVRNALPAIEGGHPEISAPISRTESNLS